MRYSAWCLAASLLVCVSTSQAQVGGTEAQKRSAQAGLAAADWKKNLTTGPNGPIPAIVIDHFGYALLRSAMIVPSNLRPANRMR